MRILVAVDGSECSDAAVNHVARISWPSGSELRVVTVSPRVEESWLSGSATTFDQIVSRQQEESRRKLVQAAATLANGHPEWQVTTALLEGSTKDAIVAEAEQFQADMVVVGSHGYGPIRRYFLGSVSQYVANNAPCSVVIVRQDAEQPDPARTVQPAISGS